MALQREVLISVDTDEPAVLSDIADRLSAAGLDVSAVHDAISVITGTIDEDGIAGLQQVAGVLDVERQRSFRIPPPGSDVQ